MGWSLVARNQIVNSAGQGSGAGWFAAFVADPEVGGAEVSGGAYARVQATYPAAVDGSTSNPVVELNIPGGTTVTHWGRFSTASGGTAFDVRKLPGPGETFGSAGTLKVINNITQAAV